MALKWSISNKNPAIGVAQFNHFNQVNNVMTEDQMKNFISVVKAYPNQTIGRICLMLLSTGVRLNSVLQARWSQFDFERRIWTVPADLSKSRKSFSLPLNDSAIQILKQQPRYETTDLVFPNPRTKRAYVNIGKPWRKIREQAGLPKLRAHDLRHQFATNLLVSGRSLFEAQKLLSHSSPLLTQRYPHLAAESKTLQDAANAACIDIQGGSD
jgi:integrase